MDTYYVHVGGSKLNHDPSKVFSYKPLQNRKDLILKDMNLYDQLEINGFPYFILIDPHGKIVYNRLGYVSKDLQVITDAIASKLQY